MPGALRELSIVTDDGVELAGEAGGPGRRRGPPIVAPPRSDGNASLCGDGLADAGARGSRGDRLRRARAWALDGGPRIRRLRLRPPRPTTWRRCSTRSELERALLAGASMGAHTALRLALRHPERVAGLGLITPSFDPSAVSEPVLAGWDALARGLREGGVEGFVDAYDSGCLPSGGIPSRRSCASARRPRASRGGGRRARSGSALAAFEDLRELESIEAPTVVVASRDEADPGHPLAVGERYAQAIPGARLLVEDPGPPPRSPIAWQGGQLRRCCPSWRARLFEHT